MTGTPDRRRAAVVLTVLVVLAAAVRLYRLGIPETVVFDEVYYAQDACFYLGWNGCGVEAEASFVHPPLGKWFIAVGIALAGYNPVGWRSAAALAGVLTIVLIFVLARRLTGGLVAPAVAAAVVALDPLSIVSSRVAMLDAFVSCAVAAMLLFAVLDRDSLRGDLRRSPRLVRPWRVAIGVVAGCAVATKWSGSLVLVGVIALVLVWEMAAAREAGHPRRAGLLRAWPSVLLWLIAMPFTVYVASYVGRLDGTLAGLPWQEGSWWREFIGRQLFMMRFHIGLDDTHPYASPAWSWLLGKRAVVYYFHVDPSGRYSEILGLVNPVVWMPAVVAWLAAAAFALRSRSPWSAEMVVAAAVTAAYVPWLGLSSDRSFVFLHYVLPVIPFLALSLGWVVSRAPPLGRRWIGGLMIVTALTAFVFWEPLIYARPLEYDDWRMRIPFTDCTAEEWRNGQLMPRAGGGAPPPGWCWV